MIRVEMKYRRYLLRRSIAMSVPTKWSELSEHQFKAVAGQMFGKWSSERFFCQFFLISSDVLHRLDGFQIFKLSELIGFISDMTLPCNLWILPRLGEYRAPEPNLTGVTLQAWMTVDTYFSKYILTGKEDFLDRGIAALYLRKGVSYSGKKVVDIAREAQRISGYDPETKKAIVLNYVLIKNWLSQSYPDLFPIVKPTSASAKKAKGTDWLEIFDRLVGDNITKIDDYKKMMVNDAFRIMNRRIKEARTK